jgi:hypothetical protein
MKKRLIALTLLAGGVVFGQVSIGIRIGAPPPPRVVSVLPSRPGPEFIWVEGYWYPVGSHYRWHDGYWTRPPYAGARWVGPRHDGERFYEGYWDGDHGRRDHDHKFDKHHDRDWHDHDRDRDHDRH